MTNTKRSNYEYLLGTVVDGAEYLFTELPTFKTAGEAHAYWSSKPRNGVGYVFERCDVSRLGVVYGLDCKVVATAGVL